LVPGTRSRYSQICYWTCYLGSRHQEQVFIDLLVSRVLEEVNRKEEALTRLSLGYIVCVQVEYRAAGW
jgi:hypothetical protein